MAPRKTLASLCLSFLAVPALAGTPPHGAAGSLYARLGGATKVSAIVEQAVKRVAGSVDRANLDHVKSALTAHICAVSGGGCRTGRDSLEMTDAEFLVLVEELRGAMRAARIPLPARNELLELLVPPTRDVARL